MKIETIEIIKNWPELKSVRNIKVFLGFTIFYQQFISSFNRIIAIFILILKTTGLLNKLAPNINNGSKLNFSKNNNSKPVFKKNNSDGKIEYDDNSVEHIILRKSKS